MRSEWPAEEAAKHLGGPRNPELCGVPAARTRPALPGPASPLRPGPRHGPLTPDPHRYLHCWGWPGGSGARRTGGEGTSRAGPGETRGSSRPATRERGGNRRSRSGAAGVPHPGARSPASSFRSRLCGSARKVLVHDSGLTGRSEKGCSRLFFSASSPTRGFPPSDTRF